MKSMGIGLVWPSHRCRLKSWTACSRRSAPASESNMPRFRRLFVAGLRLHE